MSGFIGLLVVLVLVVVCVLLFRSMQAHMRKVPKNFDPPPDDQSTGG
jgi:hypothetical protein